MALAVALAYMSRCPSAGTAYVHMELARGGVEAMGCVHVQGPMRACVQGPKGDLRIAQALSSGNMGNDILLYNNKNNTHIHLQQQHAHHACLPCTMYNETYTYMHIHVFSYYAHQCILRYQVPAAQ